MVILPKVYCAFSLFSRFHFKLSRLINPSYECASGPGVRRHPLAGAQALPPIQPLHSPSYVIESNNTQISFPPWFTPFYWVNSFRSKLVHLHAWVCQWSRQKRPSETSQIISYCTWSASMVHPIYSQHFPYNLFHVWLPLEAGLRLG